MTHIADAGFPAGIATGIGPMPGTDPHEAARVVLGEVALPFLPELPGRGVGADLVGRTAGLLTDLPVDFVHRTYRLAAAPTAETRRARDLLRWDLDAIEECWERAGHAGGVLKIQACGPYTFAAQAELRGGHKILRDHGAVRAVTESLTAGLHEQAAELERRLDVAVVVQLDEPAIGAVLDGTVPALTRLDPIPPIPVEQVAEGLERLGAGLRRPLLLHSCAPPRWELLRRVPSFGCALEMALLAESGYDDLGALLDSGRVVAAGVVPTVDPGVEPGRLAEDLVTRLHRLIDRIGLPRSVVREQMLITPTRGLAGAGERWATTALAVATAVADGL